MVSPDSKVILLDLTPTELEAELSRFMRDRGEPAYRTGQIVQKLWQQPVEAFDDMTDLPKSLRAALGAAYRIPNLELSSHQVSTDGTEKFLFRLHDGQAVETVAIPDGDRLTLCISSQAGCALQCTFCATGAMGFARNLAPHEIAGQVRALAMLSPPRRATNVVFMGMGEPLMNWAAVDVALTLLNDPRGLGIGSRHITISTVGILPGIIALSERPEQFRLAISIHAPNDELRHTLMPINTKYPLDEVIDAARAFDRRVTLEYVMLGGVNDGPEHATELASLARDCAAFVNLIPLHPGGAGDFTPTPAKHIRAFAQWLGRHGVEVAIRRSRGKDISAACGQLRVERLRRQPPVRSEHDRQVDKEAGVGPHVDSRTA